MKIGLIVTSRGRIEVLERFFSSIVSRNINDNVYIVLVKQGKWEWELPDLNGRLSVVSVEFCSLSKARNIGLNEIRDCVDVIGFPDDDCWYPDSTLSSVSLWFARHPGVDGLSVRIYDPIRQIPYGRRPRTVEQIGSTNIFRLPISVGLFIRSQALSRIGGFNEMLGVGTVAGAGEETEIVARLLLSDGKIMYDGRIEVYHEVEGGKGPLACKEFKYGRGCGITHRILVGYGMIGVVVSFWDLAVRSLVGAMVYCGSFRRCCGYLGRLLGLVCGLVYGWPRRHHSTCVDSKVLV